MTATPPEVLVLGPAEPGDQQFQKLLDLLVENGIHLTTSGQPAAFQAVLLDADLPGAAAVTGPVVRYHRPAAFRWDEEHPLHLLVSQLVMVHGVTPQHPAALAARAAVPDRDLILGQAEACLRLEPDWCRKWCDSSLVRLQAIWSAATFYQRDDLRQTVLDCVDETLVTYAAAPVYGRGETPGGLFKHPIYPGLLLPLWRETGEVRYRDAALASMETLDEARAIAAEWRDGTPFLQCESLDRKPWQWAMRARWCDQPEFYGPAVTVMRAGYDTLFDPDRQLWAHYGVRGRRRGLPWGRGQGWALYGLLGLLEHLPADHPHFAELRSWLDLTAAGLARTQDPVTGLWHNVMGEPATRLETSGTAKCVRHLARAWRLGLCRAPFVPDLLARAWFGMKAHTHQFRSCTRVHGTGPGCDVPFYSTIGTGGSYVAAMQAGSEYVRAFGPLVD